MGVWQTDCGSDMARSDLLISLVKAGSSGDTAQVRSVAEAIIAEERVKRHNILADRLTDVMRVNGGDSAAAFIGPSQRQHRQFLLELTPQRRLADLVLTDVARQACEELVEEQHRASILRTHSIEPRHRVLLVGPPWKWQDVACRSDRGSPVGVTLRRAVRGVDRQLPRGNRVTSQACVRLRADDTMRPVLR